MDMLLFGVPVVALTIGLVEVIKKLGLPKKWCPVIAIGIGVVVSFIAGGFVITPDMIIGGIIIGLSSSGLYSGTKAVVKKKNE